MRESEGADRRRRPWWSSPARGADGVPAADCYGGGVDGTAHTTANATTSTARLGMATSGDRSGGGGGGEEGDDARAIESTEGLSEMGKKRDGMAVVLK
uniref:Uncharacterized protein n=1 Tax=Oryza sativa subsp. japonica TaxID=39947 RepID=Q6YSJ0_ORYSJ|nr:hypothetical protein [Oryza sativa Japonica Group]BAD32051.1 hypothetical protein [Oryza sativa Japonica Group]